MIHPTDEDLLSHLDGELDAAHEREVAVHVGSCLPCRARMKGLEDTLGALGRVVEELDAAAPASWSVPPLGIQPLRPASPVARRSDVRATGLAWRWVAGIALLLIGTGASASLVTRQPRQASVAPVAVAVEPTAESSEAGAVLVRPWNDTIRVTIEGAGRSLPIDAAPHDQPEVSVAVAGAGVPRFAATRGAVVVTLTDPSAAAVRVRFPTTLRSGGVYVDGREVLRILDGRVVARRVGPDDRDASESLGRTP